ncbi:hypothetical protein FO440_22560 [Mucilaginibacter corticis]|uniref:Uncharacterized protein n=1 Tax=Mucilaginibacter corticis TaxID=2597670 RepID=A0A556M9P3_9SPHI|nr:hypothetical protein [Mucilaginibacter corticis]TSJ36612.1 hypothetical protein FO440_22560 [Mucilaginibacter corticis]
MKPFVYNFLERPHSDNFDFLAAIEYSPEQNLSVLTGSKTPAIDQAALSTQTTTKAGLEGADSDRQEIQSMGTMTVTRANVEGTDHDHHRNLSMYLGTQTLTRLNNEQVDSDDNRYQQNYSA